MNFRKATYAALRSKFLEDSNLEEHFDFSEYLSTLQGHCLAEVVEVRALCRQRRSARRDPLAGPAGARVHVGRLGSHHVGLVDPFPLTVAHGSGTREGLVFWERKAEGG
jgi:hypothetical protein